jgi:hypothetical protein
LQTQLLGLFSVRETFLKFMQTANQFEFATGLALPMFICVHGNVNLFLTFLFFGFSTVASVLENVPAGEIFREEMNERLPPAHRTNTIM